MSQETDSFEDTMSDAQLEETTERFSDSGMVPEETHEEPTDHFTDSEEAQV